VDLILLFIIEKKLKNVDKNLSLIEGFGMILVLPLMLNFLIIVTMNLKKTFIAVVAMFWMIESASANTNIIKPEIKYNSKRFALKLDVNDVKLLEVEIRDSYDNLLYSTKYYDVTNFEKTYNISQLSKGKYFVTVKADGKVYRDVIKVKRLKL
jgi:hypothetical protein